MKKILVMSMAAASLLSGGSFNETFKEGKASGQIRAAHVANDFDAGTNDYATALGGVLKYETGVWNNLKLGVAGYISQKAGFATGEDTKTNGDFFDANKTSYGYLGESYLDYSSDDFTLRVGRQLLDTPLADTDDIRMHPNTFEAAVATYSGIEKTTLVGAYVTRWAGYDSGSDISTFKKIGGAESRGAAVAGVISSHIENLGLQGWYYGINRVAEVFYGDATYTLPFNETAGVAFSAQYATFNEDKASTTDGDVYGFGININVGMFTLGGAYNRAVNDDGKSVVNGYGGGPYLTSMEEWTIDGMEDARAYQFSTAADMAPIGIEGMSISALYGVFKSVPLERKIKEWDIILAYELSETLSMESSYAKVNDCNDNADDGADAGYSRFLTRINYNF